MSVSKEVRLLGDFDVIVSIMPCLLELSEDDVDGRGSSSEIDGRVASAGYDDMSSSVASIPCETDGGDTLDSIVEVEIVLGVRNWVLETACLSIVGTLKVGFVAGGNKLNECGFTGLGNEVAAVGKEALGLSTAGLAAASPLMLFCGNERGDGL